MRVRVIIYYIELYYIAFVGCLLLVVLMQVKSTLKHDFLGKIMPFCKKTRKILHFLKKKSFLFW